MLRQMTDGFSLDTHMLPLLYQYRTAAVSQLEVLRRAQGFQAQWIVVPQESREPLAAFDQLEYQATILPGSWVWGYSVKATFAGVNSPNLIHIYVEDEGTGQYWESDFEPASAYTAFNRPADERGEMPIPMVQPFPITEPGKLNVRIANENNAEADVQLILSIARICKGRSAWPQECLP